MSRVFKNQEDTSGRAAERVVDARDKFISMLLNDKRFVGCILTVWFFALIMAILTEFVWCEK